MPNSGDASAPSDASLGRGNVAHDALDERQERESPGDSCKRYFFGTDRLVAARQQQKLLDLYLFAVDACLRSGTDQWWRRAFRFEAFPDAEQGLAALKDFCLHHLLYEGGDIAAFCRVYEGLEEEGYLEDDIQGRFLLELSRYLKRALQEAGDDLAPGRTRVVPKRPRSSEDELHEGVADQLRRHFDRALEKIGLASAPESPPRPAIVSMVFPDEVAVDNFREFGAPSLCGERGLQALCGARVVSLLVFAKPKYLMDIKGHLEASNPGCQVVCRAIPPNLSNLAEGATGPQRDWLVGALQGLHLREAKRLGADFLSINPNAVYSDGFFEGVLGIADRQEPAVAVLLATIRADKNIIRPGLAQFRTARPFDSSLIVGTSLSVSAGDLLSQGIDTAGPLNGAKFVHDFGQLRGLTSHLQLTWREDDCVRIHSTRYEIAFLAGEMIGKMPPRFFAMPCAEVDRILAAGAQPHFVGKSDAIAMLELGGENSTSAGDAMDYAEFGELVSGLTRERQGQFFKHPICLPLSRAVHQERADRGAATIDADGSVVFDTIDQTRLLAKPTADQILAALNVLHQYELSEYGLENLAATISEGRRILDIDQVGGTAIDEAALRDLIRAAMNFDHVDKAIALAKMGQGGTAFIHDFFVKMMEMKATNAARARDLLAKSPEQKQKRKQKQTPKQSYSVVGSVVWGQAYVDKFMNYCVPSLLAKGNIPALSKKGKVVHSIVTTETDRDAIAAHPIFARLSEFADVMFTCFPEEFLERRQRAQYNFYHFYGLLDHQNVFLASALQADLYLLPIDCVYSSESLKNFSAYLEKDADCCSVAGIEADESQLRAWLDAKARSTSDVLNIDSEELLQTVGVWPDAYFRSLIMNPDNTAFCRHPRELVWPFADGLVIHSIFMHPLAVSASLISRPFHPQHENVDYALLPRLLQDDGRLKIIEDAREVAIAHFGAPLIRDDYREGGFSIGEFIEAHKYDYAAQRRCFAVGQFFPCRNLPYSPSVDYAGELAQIQSALIRYRFRIDSR